MGGNLKIIKVTSFSETSTSSRKRRSTDKATANFEAEITTDDSTSDDEVKDSITATIQNAVDTYDSLDTDSFNSIDIELDTLATTDASTTDATTIDGTTANVETTTGSDRKSVV